MLFDSAQYKKKTVSSAKMYGMQNGRELGESFISRTKADLKQNLRVLRVSLL